MTLDLGALSFMQVHAPLELRRCDDEMTMIYIDKIREKENMGVERVPLDKSIVIASSRHTDRAPPPRHQRKPKNVYHFPRFAGTPALESDLRISKPEANP